MTIAGFADKVLTGSGKKPFRLLGWLAAMWFVNLIVFSLAAEKMAPTNAALLANDKIGQKCREVGWTNCNETAMQEYPKFYRGLYALDVLVPIMDLQQSRLWQPISGDGGWGTFTFFWRCFAGAFGWLLGIALSSLALRYVSEPKEWSQIWGLTRSGK